MSVSVENPWKIADRSERWGALTAAERRERILSAAGSVFSRQGLDAPMPAVAAAAGVGVASVYRRFPSKQDLLAALVLRRLDQIAEATRVALKQPGLRWSALTEMLWSTVAREGGDDFLGQAWERTREDPGVATATESAFSLMEQLLDQARREGRLRSDATTEDLRLLFAATRAVNRLAPDARRRMLTLLIDGLDGRSGSAGRRDGEDPPQSL